MKKIMTALLCALGFSLASQAEKISGTNFEGLNVDFGVIGKTDDGLTDGGYWSNTVSGVEALVATNTFTIVDVPQEEGDPIPTEVPVIAPYSGTVGYPSVHGNADSEKYLSINTKGGELVRNIQEGGTAQPIGNGIYFDAMVQFTSTDSLDASAGSADDKLIVWLRENGDGTTNLVVTAGYLNNAGDATKANYVIDNPVQADKWYRLTIQAIENAINDGDNAYTCYAIYIDGVKATYSTEVSAFDGEYGYTVQSPYSGYLHNETVHALFPSLLGHSNLATNFTAVAFSGVGGVDDIEFTRDAPKFTEPPASLTVDWTVGIATVTITPAEGDPIVIEPAGVAGSTNITEKGSYTVAATVQTGYVAPTVSNSQVDVVDSDVVVNVSTQPGYAQVGDTLYATLADAVVAVGANGTVKLYQNNDMGSTALSVANANAFVLDLNGKVLSGANSDAVVMVGSAVTIIDSVGGGAISNTTEAMSVVVDGGSLVVGLAENDMGASFYGSVGPADAEPLSIVRGNFYSDNATSIGGFVAHGSVGDMIEGCYVVAPDTNVYVAQIGGNKYTTLADAIAAAQNNDTVTLLADIDDLTATINIEKTFTLDLNDYNIVATDARAFWVKSGKLTVMGAGVISSTASLNSGFSSDSSVIRVGDSVANANTAEFELGADAKIASDHCYGVTVFGKNDAIIADFYGTVEVTGTNGAISGNGLSNPVTINVFDGAVVSATADAGIYFPSAGYLNIAGGSVTGPVAVYAKAGDINISDGTFTATGVAAPYANNTNGLNPTGDALVIDNCGYPSGSTLDVCVSGGTFSSVNGSAVASYAYGSSQGIPREPVGGFVSGGTFNTALETEYCASGFIPADNGDGTYGVEAGYTITFVNGEVTLYTTNIAAAATVAYVGETPTKAADESYTYTFNGWTPAIVSPAVADATYTATYTATPVAPAAPVVDGQTVEPGEEFDTATTEKPITYPSTPTVTGEVGNQTITYGTSGSVPVPEYYTATVDGNTVNLTLNDNALATIGDATVAEEAKQAVEVGDETVGVTLTTTNQKLYYGVQTCSTPDGTFTLQGTPQQGTGSAMQLSVTRGENETAKFYRLYVTDIAPASGN